MICGEMDGQWVNSEIATCAIAGTAKNWPRGQSRVWNGHIVNVYDQFSILPRGSRNATHRPPKRVNGKAALKLPTSK